MPFVREARLAPCAHGMLSKAGNFLAFELDGRGRRGDRAGRQREIADDRCAVQCGGAGQGRISAEGDGVGIGLGTGGRDRAAGIHRQGLGSVHLVVEGNDLPAEGARQSANARWR